MASFYVKENGFMYFFYLSFLSLSYLKFFILAVRNWRFCDLKTSLLWNSNKISLFLSVIITMASVWLVLVLWIYINVLIKGESTFFFFTHYFMIMRPFLFFFYHFKSFLFILNALFFKQKKKVYKIYYPFHHLLRKLGNTLQCVIS